MRMRGIPRRSQRRTVTSSIGGFRDVIDLDSVTIAYVPDADEAARVHFTNSFRTPAGIAMSLILGLLALATCAFGIRAVVGGHPVVGVTLILSGGALVAGPEWFIYLFYRHLFRRTVEKGDLGTITITRTGIDSNKEHVSAHRGWPAVKSAKRIPEGLLLH